MPKLTIALAQVNATVGDLAANAQTIIDWTSRAAARGARLVLFPEMMLSGYPVEDLALRASFVDACAQALRDTAERLAEAALGHVAVVTGYLDRDRELEPRVGRPATAALDAAALLHGGRVLATTAKHHLPNYGVFDEYRYFVPGMCVPVFRLPCGDAPGTAAVAGQPGTGAQAHPAGQRDAAGRGDAVARGDAVGQAVDVAIAICEDLWQDGGPVAVTRQAGASLLVVPNASPYERGKDAARLELCQRRAAEAGAVLAYANMVGGQDELVFDGDSILVGPDGRLLARGPQFEEALIVAGLELPAAATPAPGIAIAASGDRTAGARAVGDESADARDGTQMTIHRLSVPALPPPPPPVFASPATSSPPPGAPVSASRSSATSPGGREGPEREPAAGEPAEREPGGLWRPLAEPTGHGQGAAGPVWPRLEPLAEVYAALVTGVRDYVGKNRFRSVIIALSGGIDSALTATIAADAIGPDRVHVVLMPSRYSSGHSVADAEDLVKRQGMHARTVPINPMVEAFEAQLSLGGLAAENLQARIRGVALMGLSNAEGHLVLTTGNKSEVATGYSTLYGDSAGGFAPIKDVPKTLVWELSRWRNSEASRRGESLPIPENSITKPPSAELAPGQLDTDSLPDYALLDAVLDDYVVKDMGAAELAAAGHDPGLVHRVIAMVDRAEYKRRQYPPGPKITPRNFGRDRRLPITNRWAEPVTGAPPAPGPGPDAAAPAGTSSASAAPASKAPVGAGRAATGPGRADPGGAGPAGADVAGGDQQAPARSAPGEPGQPPTS